MESGRKAYSFAMGTKLYTLTVRPGSDTLAPLFLKNNTVN